MESYLVFEVKVATEETKIDKAVAEACRTLIHLDDLPTVTTTFSHIEDGNGNWKWLD